MKSKKIAALASPILTVIIGIILFANSVGSTVLVCRIIGIILLISGAFFTGSSLLNGTIHKFGIILGVFQLILGLFITSRPDKMVAFITVFIGIIVLVKSIGLLEHGLENKAIGLSLWWVTASLALIMAVLGIIIIFNPFGAVSTVMKFAGIIIIIQGISDIVALIKADKASNRNSGDFIEADYTIKK